MEIRSKLEMCFSEEEIASDVFGGPPLEHDIAAGEAEHSHERCSIDGGIRWDRVSNLDQVSVSVSNSVPNKCFCRKQSLRLFRNSLSDIN